MITNQELLKDMRLHDLESWKIREILDELIRIANLNQFQSVQQFKEGNPDEYFHQLKQLYYAYI